MVNKSKYGVRHLKDIFDTSVYELLIHLRRFLLSAKSDDEIRILDWTDSLNNDNAYLLFSEDGSDGECAEKTLCQLPVNIDSFCDETVYDDTECLKFNNISLRDVKDKSYDLVVLRHMTERDSGIDDVIKCATKALKDGGVLYTNLIITKELNEIFKATERYGLCLSAATKIIMEQGLLEYNYGYEVDDERLKRLEFKYLYDIQGYIQLAFKKGKCEKFVYTEVSDRNSHLEEDPSVIEFLFTAFSNIDVALDGKRSFLYPDNNKWIRSTEEIDITEVKNYIPRMKEDSYFGLRKQPLIPNSVKIRFSDYFEADTPHHTKLSELNPREYYYLSPSNEVHCLIDNTINSDKPLLSENILREVNLNNLGNIYDLIDVNGCVIDGSKKFKDGIMGSEKGKMHFEEYPPVELYILNYYGDANIDIEGTLLYNLIRIKPKGNQINLEYLKMFFYTDDLTKLRVLDIRNRERYPSFMYDLAKDKADHQHGYYAIHYFSDNHCFLNTYEEHLNPDENGIYHDTAFGTYTVEDVAGSYIYVDDLKYHKKLISNFKLRQDESVNRYKAIVQKRFANIAFMNNLHKREEEVKARYDEETVISLINAEKELANGELIYDLYSKLNEDISLKDYYTAIEIYLRLCLACCKNKEKIDCGYRYIGNIGEFTMGDLFYIYRNRDNKKFLFKRNVNEDKYKLLLQRLSKYRNARNEAAHSSSRAKSDEAEDMINEIYQTLMMIDEMLAY